MRCLHSVAACMLFAAVACAAEYDDPLIIWVNDFGPHVLDRDHVYRTSGIVIDQRYHWNPGDVVIDLGGHTLTFGAEAHVHRARTYVGDRTGNVAHNGVMLAHLGAGEFGHLFAWGKRRPSKVIVRNGTIRTGGSEGLAFASGVLNFTGVEMAIEDITFVIDAPDSMAVNYGNWGAPGVVQRCDISVLPYPVANRHKLPAALRNVNRAIGNTVRCASLVGIAASGTNALVENNAITLDVVDGEGQTNAYAILFANAGGTARGNRIRNVGGRGIHTHSNGTRIENNTIDTKNASTGYPTHGIKLEGGNDVAISDCDVTARSYGDEGGHALDISNGDNRVGIVVRDSVFTALNEGKYAAAANLWLGDFSKFEFQRLHLRSDSYFLRFVWRWRADLPAPRNAVFRECVFERLGGEQAFVDWATAPNGGDSHGNRLVDCEFLRGANPRTAQGARHWGGELRVDWTCRITGADGPVKITDVTGTVVYEGVPDEAGEVSCELTEVQTRRDPQGLHVTEFNPHTITCGMQSKQVAIAAPCKISFAEPPISEEWIIEGGTLVISGDTGTATFHLKRQPEIAR